MPAGALIVGLQKLGGETMREKRRRERRELYELRVAEWYVLILLYQNHIFIYKLTSNLMPSTFITFLFIYLFIGRNARLQLTDEIIGEFSGRDKDTEGDLQRIKELLSQPRNEESAKES